MFMWFLRCCVANFSQIIQKKTKTYTQTCHSSRFKVDIPIFQYKSRTIPISRFHVWKSRVFVLFQNWKNQRAFHFVTWPVTSSPQSVGLKYFGWIDGLGLILWTPRLSEWSRLSFPSPRTNMMPLFCWFEDPPIFPRFYPISSICNDVGRGNRESAKFKIIIQRNSEINEATKLIYIFIFAKQLPPIPFY